MPFTTCNWAEVNVVSVIHSVRKAPGKLATSEVCIVFYELFMELSLEYSLFICAQWMMTLFGLCVIAPEIIPRWPAGRKCRVMMTVTLTSSLAVCDLVTGLDTCHNA